MSYQSRLHSKLYFGELLYQSLCHYTRFLTAPDVAKNFESAVGQVCILCVMQARYTRDFQLTISPLSTACPWLTPIQLTCRLYDDLNIAEVLSVNQHDLNHLDHGVQQIIMALEILRDIERHHGKKNAI